MWCPWLSGWFLVSISPAAPETWWDMWLCGGPGSECPELGKIPTLEMEALGAVGFLLDCFPDWYCLKKNALEKECLISRVPGCRHHLCLFSFLCLKPCKIFMKH